MKPRRCLTLSTTLPTIDKFLFQFLHFLAKYDQTRGLFLGHPLSAELPIEVLL
jgi:hypothetical protein